MKMQCMLDKTNYETKPQGMEIAKITNRSENNTMKKKYFAISEKSTADALNYLGFKYMKFTNNDGTTTYSFENTEGFHEARTKLWKLRQEYRKE